MNNENTIQASNYQILVDALKWALRTISDSIDFFVPFLLIGGVAIFLVSLFSLGILFLPVSFYFTLCFVKVAFLFLKNQTPTRQDFWVTFPCFLRCLAALLIYAFIVTIGLLFFILPGLYLASRYYYIIYCIIGDNESILGSFSCSEKITRDNRLLPFYLLVLATLFGSTYILIPLAALINGYIYKYLQKKSSSI